MPPFFAIKISLYPVCPPYSMWNSVPNVTCIFLIEITFTPNIFRNSTVEWCLDKLIPGCLEKDSRFERWLYSVKIDDSNPLIAPHITSNCINGSLLWSLGGWGKHHRYEPNKAIRFGWSLLLQIFFHGYEIVSVGVSHL